MKRKSKVLCIIGAGIIGVFLAVSTVYACCGVNPYITDDEIPQPVCLGQEVVISGVIKGVEEWYDAYSTGPVEMTIAVSSPSGDVTNPDVTLSDLYEYKPPGQNINRYATWDFTATYTPTETGTYTYVKTVKWTSALNMTMTQSESGEFEVEVCEIEVAVDIKPTSCPNPLNVTSKGVLPVAVLGTEEFDVSTVDPASIKLIGVPPLRWALEDVATPFEPFLGKEECDECTEEGPDGYLDLTLKFDVQAIVAALGDVEDGDCEVLPLEGKLLDELGGTTIKGEDVVIILKKGGKK